MSDDFDDSDDWDECFPWLTPSPSTIPELNLDPCTLEEFFEFFEPDPIQPQVQIQESYEGLIEVGESYRHSKASERYVRVVFIYPSERWEGSVPIEYRRTGVQAQTNEAISGVLSLAYESLRPSNRKVWLEQESRFWSSRTANVTQEFFDALSRNTWVCVSCGLPPSTNPSRRVQSLKDLGYTLSTDFCFCPQCRKNKTHFLMLSMPRVGAMGYDSLSPSFRDHVLETLRHQDAYENRVSEHLLPDHKFPEIRWGSSTRPEAESPEGIRDKFQLLCNRRNLQKREACRECYQTGVRGFPFGIRFYYQGNHLWPQDVPLVGTEAESGCVGCGWYDLQAWRSRLNARISREIDA